MMNMHNNVNMHNKKNELCICPINFVDSKHSLLCSSHDHAFFGEGELLATEGQIYRCNLTDMFKKKIQKHI